MLGVIVSNSVLLSVSILSMSAIARHFIQARTVLGKRCTLLAAAFSSLISMVAAHTAPPSGAACTAITTHSLSGVAPRAIYTRTREPSPGWR